MMKKYFIIILMVFNIAFLIADDTVSGMSPEEYATPKAIKKNGITWYFEEAVEYGRFVNGDYWVRGPVTIIAIDPAPGDVVAVGTTRYGNGSMVNPITNEGQGFDEGANDWDDSHKISLPITLYAGDSIVSTISVSDDYMIDDSDTTCIDGTTPTLNHCKLWKASVLTCVEYGHPYNDQTEEYEDYFRPSFMGENKVLYDSKNLNKSALPSLNSVTETPSSDDIQDYIEQIKNPWLSINYDYGSRKIHPAQNMPNYHANVVTLLSDIANLILLDETVYTEELLVYTIQLGIDWYNMCILGWGDSAFIEWPVLFAGLMLDDSDMLSVFINDLSRTPGRPTERCYYWNENTSEYSSEIVEEGQIWTSYSTDPIPFWRQSDDTAHEHLDPIEWEWLEETISGGGSKREGYRGINSRAWLGCGLSAIILGLETEWNHPAYFDYMDRWMSESNDLIASKRSDLTDEEKEDIGGYQKGSSAFVTEIWNTYRDNY